MKVQIRIEVPLVERMDVRRVRRGDVAVAHVLADHRSVFRFHQPVVVALSRPRFGLLDQQIFQQPRDRIVDELRTVVGMKAPHRKRKLRQNPLQNRL